MNRNNLFAFSYIIVLILKLVCIYIYCITDYFILVNVSIITYSSIEH